MRIHNNSTKYKTWGLILLVLGGCNVPAGTQQGIEADEAFRAGIQAYDAKDFSKAIEMFRQAKAIGLQTEPYVDAQLKESICLASLGEHEAALKILGELEQGAPNLDEVFATKSYVLLKQGKQTQADSELAKAKRINPAIRRFENK